MKFSGWQYKYTDRIFSLTPDRHIPEPDTYFKYYALNQHNVAAFTKSQFYFSHPLVLNDPFDSSIQIVNLSKLTLPQLVKLYIEYKDLVWADGAPDNETIRKRIVDWSHSDHRLREQTLTFFWHNLMRQLGILSLTDSADNMLLWSYYNYHTGFAVEFSNLPVDNQEVFGPFPINYASQFDTIYAKDIDLSAEQLLYLCNVKSTVWQHELEWRLLLRRPELSIPEYPAFDHLNANRLVSYAPSSLKSVILGFKFFKDFLPEEIDKEHYRYTVQPGVEEETIALKIMLLNHLIDAEIPVGQVQTLDNNTFGIRTDQVELSTEKSGHIYMVKRKEKKTPNLRYFVRP